MTARELMTETLKSIPEFQNRVFFVNHPPDQGYPCVVYTHTGYRDLRLLNSPGSPFAQYFTVDVRTITPEECEQLTNKVFTALRKTNKMEDKISIDFQYENADASSNSVRDQYGIYRGITVYLIRGN